MWQMNSTDTVLNADAQCCGTTAETVPLPCVSTVDGAAGLDQFFRAMIHLEEIDARLCFSGWADPVAGWAVGLSRCVRRSLHYISAHHFMPLQYCMLLTKPSVSRRRPGAAGTGVLRCRRRVLLPDTSHPQLPLRQPVRTQNVSQFP